MIGVVGAFVLLNGCQNHKMDNPEPVGNPKQANDLSGQGFPERPVLGPGETNSTKSASKSAGTNSIGTMAAGLTTTDLNTLTPEQLVQSLIISGPNAPAITNVTYSGSKNAAGSFSGGTGIIGFESGIVLSSGKVASVAGPNIRSNTSTNNGSVGDADLNKLIQPRLTRDAAVLEFDFTCEYIQTISFQYVFSSEEYNEFVNSQFNDVFAFFLNGKNIAVVPSTTTPVAINTINCGNPSDGSPGSNCNLFINNEGGTTINTEMDGLTVVLTATSTLQPGTNHIKLAIADVGDGGYDSNVFLKGESFVCAPPEIGVQVDIKPGSCPNPLNTKQNGVLPVAIAGSPTLNVNDLDLATLKLEGVSLAKSSVEDVISQYKRPEGSCECTTTGGDGYNDLVLHLTSQQVVKAMGEVTNRESRVLSLTGNLKDGTPIKGSDCVLVIHN
jgi:hypothetical protein